MHGGVNDVPRGEEQMVIKENELFMEQDNNHHINNMKSETDTTLD